MDLNQILAIAEERVFDLQLDERFARMAQVPDWDSDDHLAEQAQALCEAIRITLARSWEQERQDRLRDIRDDLAQLNAGCGCEAFFVCRVCEIEAFELTAYGRDDLDLDYWDRPVECDCDL